MQLGLNFRDLEASIRRLELRRRRPPNPGHSQALTNKIISPPRLQLQALSEPGPSNAEKHMEFLDGSASFKSLE